MGFMDKVYEIAKEKQRTIVLPEASDPRVVKAAQEISEKGYAKVILVGNEEQIKKLAEEEKSNVSTCTIIDPHTSELKDTCVEAYYKKREKKGMTLEKAKDIVLNDTLFFGAMMVALGKADGMVAGAIRSTGDTMRSIFHCVGTAEGIKTISSFFAMVLPEKQFGNDGLLFFADCAVNPNPNAKQLADIAISTADNYKLFTGDTPSVAMLSFSTKGSAKHPDVDKVLEALAIIKEARPDIDVDGELQLDAALIPAIGAKKAPDSKVAGNANVLVFPDLDAANIGYKLTQRLAKAEAIGPVVQGGAKPINDLSRGCSVEDIVKVTAITATQVID